MHLTLTHFAALRCKPALYIPVGTKFDHQKRIALGLLASLDCIKVYRTAFSFRNDSNLFVSGEVLPAGRGKEHKGWKPLCYRHFAGKRGEKNKKVTVGRETSPGWCWVSLRMFCSPLRKRTDARVTLCALCAIGCSRAELGQSPAALASWAVRSKAGNVKTKQSQNFNHTFLCWIHSTIPIFLKFLRAIAWKREITWFEFDLRMGWQRTGCCSCAFLTNTCPWYHTNDGR